MLKCFSIGSSRSRRKVDEGLEAVSEQQISQTCLAAYVTAGCVWLAFADGRHERVNTLLAQRSPLLQCALESAAGSSECLPHRERIFQWYQYVAAIDRCETWDPSTSTLIILRRLLAVDFMGDDEGVEHLTQELGARLFPEGSLNRQPNLLRRLPVLRCREQVLDELPKALALSVLQATPASLHQCLLHLPPSHHQDTLLARFPSILSDNTLQLCGQESAKVESGSSFKSCQDTISTALCASAAFPQLRQLRLSGMCLSQGRVSALSAALTKLTAVTALLFSNCLLDSNHITELLAPVATCQAIKKFSVTACLLREPASVAEALASALRRMHVLEHLDLSKLPFRATDACQVLSGVAQLAILGDLKSVKLPFLNSVSCAVTSFWPCLACCTGLSQLALVDAALTEDTVWSVSVFLGTLTKLESLEMRVERLDATVSLSFFYESLNDLTALSKLRLAGHVHSQSALVPLANALRPLLNLKHLELPGQRHKPTCQLINPLCSTLQELTKLTHLNCKAFHIPSEGYEPFELALEHLPHLSVLKLNTDASIGSAHFPDLVCARQVTHLQVAAKVHWQNAATAIVASLQVLVGLQRLDFFLDFSSDTLSKDVLEGVAALTSLTRLRLKGTGIGTNGVNALAAAAQAGRLSGLLQLRVETVGVNASAVQELAVSLPKLSALQQLSFSFSRCKDGTVDSLLTHMTRFLHLTSLEVMQARLPDSSVYLLNHAIFKMPSLARLSLSSTVIGSTGINVLSKSLPKLAALSFLSLSGCPFGDRGLSTLADSLKGLYRLRELHLNSTEITDQGAIALLAGLSHVFLTHVRFKNNDRMKSKKGSAADALSEPWIFL